MLFRSRQVRRLTDHTALLGFPRADEIANHDQAGANADAHLERVNTPATVVPLSNKPSSTSVRPV